MIKRWTALLVSSLFLALTSYGQTPPSTFGDNQLLRLAQDFWTWRAQYAPFTGDDVNRMERPGGRRDWSGAAIEKRRADLSEFETRWKQIDTAGWPIPQQVDYRLIGSALARVRWELDVNPRWERDPNFYLEQTLTPVIEALTVPGPYDEARSREILTRIANIPSIVANGNVNLKNPPAPFASVAVDDLEKIRPRLLEMATALQPSTTLSAAELNEATMLAADALEKFRQASAGATPGLAGADFSRPGRLPIFPEERRAHPVFPRATARDGPTGMGSRGGL